MSDLLHQLSNTNSNPMAQAPPSNPNGNSLVIAPGSDPSISVEAIAQKSVNPNTNEKAIAPQTHATITTTVIAPGSTNPYLVYLSQLGVGSRRTIRESLEHIARMVSEGSLDALNFPWSELR